MPSIFHLPRDERASSLWRESYPVQVSRLAIVSLAFAYSLHLIVAPAIANG